MAERFEFRTYQSADRDACLALLDENCPEFFAPNERADYETFLDAALDGYRVCVAESRIAAAFGVIATRHPTRVRLVWILVAKNWQRRGVGRAIMADVLRVAQEAQAECVDIAASHKSAPYFAKFGAEETRRLTDGWGRGMHRVDMEMKLRD
jgi:GNAT superfamily N-acetyltransferase